MRRLLRSLFNVAAMCSLLLCVSDWVNSYRHFWFVSHHPATGDALGISSDKGGVYLWKETDVDSDGLAEPVRGWDRAYRSNSSGDTDETVAGLPVRRWQPVRTFDVNNSLHRTAYVVVPHWTLAAALAAGPLMSLRRRFVRRRRQSTGLCPVCGYDLRATPGRCPECGMISTR
ncbi:MAG: hypothetical protein JWN40_1790 [Phycisphaerales bacterium]|nr:hypothetical protein [Phycisphaerales bacterium]